MKLKIIKKDSTMTLNGELTIYSVGELLNRISGIPEAAPLMCDLSGITKIDTAGFQLLLLLKKNSDGDGRLIEFSSPGKEINDIFELYGESL